MWFVRTDWYPRTDVERRGALLEIQRNGDARAFRHAAVMLGAMPRGRPSDDGIRRDDQVRIRCHTAEKMRWEAAAEEQGESLAEFVRVAIEKRIAEKGDR